MAKIFVAILLCVLIGGAAIFISNSIGAEVTDRGLDTRNALGGAVVDGTSGAVTATPPGL